MPTPSDSTDELLLPSQIEPSLHASCPPEIDRPAEWRAQVLDRLSLAGYRPDTAGAEMAVSGGDESSRQPQRLDVDGDQPAARALDTEADTKRPDRVATVDLDTTTSTNASGSPPSCHAEEKQIDEKEEQQIPMHASTSSIVDLPYSLRLGLHSSRVCNGGFGASTLGSQLTWTPAYPNLHILDAAARKQVSGYAAIRCLKI